MSSFPVVVSAERVYDWSRGQERGDIGYGTSQELAILILLLTKARLEEARYDVDLLGNLFLSRISLDLVCSGSFSSTK